MSPMLKVDGRERSYVVVPPQGAATALLLVLHGANQTGTAFQRASAGTFDHLRQHGVVVVYPDSFQGPWNDARADTPSRARRKGIDDVAFLRALAEHLATSFDVPAGWVFSVGYSDGAQMVVRLIHEAPELVAAAALLCAGLPTADGWVDGLLEADCRQPVPVVMFHGTDDPVAPYAGEVASRSRGASLPVLDAARYFAERNGFEGDPAVIEMPETLELGTRVTRTAYDDSWHRPVVLYTIVGGGHTVSNPERDWSPVLGRTNRSLDTGAIVGDFFYL